MKPLTRQDVDDIVQWGRSLSEEQGTRLLDHFENHQSQLYNAVYGVLSDAIAEDSVDMANLFMDLCFDIVLVYHRTLGEAPQEPEDTRWLESKMALLEMLSSSRSAPKARWHQNCPQRSMIGLSSVAWSPAPRWHCLITWMIRCFTMPASIRHGSPPSL
ncbi:hypothetical protein ACTL6P_00320 [Endozoicomonas acroporae]|uniref:hypothetical protein n=1 Tax=Endozoicomonas acroporae TaxID=1701104 RepID=UPI000C75C02C|nr:hypothetical protein [Endozoicomonas acroporae]